MAQPEDVDARPPIRNPPPGPRFPGDNPNLRGAKRRQGVRPRVRNVPAGAEAIRGELQWIDPLPKVDPLPIDLQPNIESVPAGYVELDKELPSHISQPFRSLFSAVAERTNLSPANITHGSEKLHALGYYKSSKQLYATLSDPDKSQLQPLKAIFYDASMLPRHMSSAIAIIGNMETKVGTVEVRDAMLLFKQWLAKGLQLDPDSDEQSEIDGDPFNFVWRDVGSKKFLDRRCREILDDCNRHDTFQLFVNDVQLACGVPRVAETQDGYQSIADQYPRERLMKQAVSFLLQSQNDFRRGEPLPNDEDIDLLIANLGLIWAPPNYTESAMREAFEDNMREYHTGSEVWINGVFHMGESPAGNQGFAAQTVAYHSHNSASFKLPMSDSDRALGYLFSPCVAFEIRPNFVVYARRRHDEAAARFAQRDAKQVAS